MSTTLPVLAQVVLSGLGSGVSYALVAVGVSIIGGLRGAAPLAQGDLLGGSLATAVLLVVGAGALATDPGALDSVLIVLALLVAGVIGGTLLFLLTRRGSDGLRGAAAALAFGVVTRDAITHAVPRGSVGVGDPLHLDRVFARGTGVFPLGGGTSIPTRLPVVIVVGAALLVAVSLLLRRSTFGRGVAAVSQDGELASLSGVDPARTLLGAFVVGGLLAAVGGLLAVPGQPLDAGTGVLLGLTALLAATLGGLGSVRGAVTAGLAVGVFEAAVAHADASAAAPVVLGSLVLVALARPGGGPWVARYR